MARKRKTTEEEPALFAPPPEEEFAEVVAEVAAVNPEADFPAAEAPPTEAPPVNPEVNGEQTEAAPVAEAPTAPAKPKRGRGRPRTKPTATPAPAVVEAPTVNPEANNPEANNGETEETTRRAKLSADEKLKLPENNLSETVVERTDTLRELLASKASDNETPAEALQRSAMVVQVSVHGFGNSRTLGKQSDQVAASALGIIASADYKGSLQVIPPGTPEWDALLKWKAAVLAWFSSPTLTTPWLVEGQRLLPAWRRLEYVEVTDGYKAEFVRLVDALSEAMPRIREEVKARHGSAYRAEWLAFDPKKRFSFQCTLPQEIQLPAWIQQLEDPAEKQARQQAWERQIELGGQIATNALLAQFGKAVANLELRLTPDANGDRRIIKEAALENVREMFDAVRNLNVTNNPALEQLVKRAESAIAGDIDAETLRHSPRLQDTTCDTLTGVLDTIEKEFLVTVPTRARNIVRKPAAPQPAA